MMVRLPRPTPGSRRWRGRGRAGRTTRRAGRRRSSSSRRRAARRCRRHGESAARRRHRRTGGADGPVRHLRLPLDVRPHAIVEWPPADQQDSVGVGKRPELPDQPRHVLVGTYVAEERRDRRVRGNPQPLPGPSLASRDRDGDHEGGPAESRRRGAGKTREPTAQRFHLRLGWTDDGVDEPGEDREEPVRVAPRRPLVRVQVVGGPDQPGAA